MQLPEVLSAVGVAVVGVDTAWRVVWQNPEAVSRLGLREGELLTSCLEGGEQRESALDAALAGGSAARGLALSRDSGGVVDAVVRAAPAGGPATAVVTLVDAAARAALEQEASRLRDRLAASERDREKLGELQRELSDASEPPTIIGSSAGMLRVFEQVERVAPAGATVLIHGETGSGKDLVARSIHARSARSRGAFVAVNCAALPESLIESELFGHERGAFTGAERRRLGKFELADGGTIFLDEIAELSMQAQAKLLRVLQNGAFERVGGAETLRIDVRVVAATHRDLARQVERGRFREDLFYRLNVFRIEVPALRDRREDIRALIEFLHERHARRMGRARLPVSERSMRRVLSYRWPGNIRELENAVERATLLAEGDELEIELPEAPTPGGGDRGGPAPASGGAAPRDVLLDLTSEQLQRMQIMHALETTGYRVFGEDGAAARLALNPQTLLSRMDKFGIPRPRQMRRARRGE